MSNTIKWHNLDLSLRDDPNEAIVLDGVTAVPPKNLRVCNYPYPHLRDDDGCVLASDYVDFTKLAYILKAVDKC